MRYLELFPLYFRQVSKLGEYLTAMQRFHDVSVQRQQMECNMKELIRNKWNIKNKYKFCKKF